MKRKTDDTAFINSFRKSDLNVMHLVADILDSDLIEDSKKLLALEDIHRMCVDKKYAQEVNFIKNRKLSVHSPTVNNHSWFTSELEAEFWDTMNEILYGK